MDIILSALVAFASYFFVHGLLDQLVKVYAINSYTPEGASMFIDRYESGCLTLPVKVILTIPFAWLTISVSFGETWWIIMSICVWCIFGTASEK